jgi:hypothetical protein
MNNPNCGCPGSGSSDSSGSSGSTGPIMPDLFASFTPEEIVLLASVIAITLASELSDANASSLAFLFSTIGSNIGLFIDRRSNERVPQIPGLG